MNPRPRLLSLLLALLVACVSSARPPPTRVAQVDSARIPVAHAPTRGRDDALVTVVAFGDATSPRSARADATLARLQLEYGDDLRVVWRNLLRDDPAARRAAEASMEAYAQGGARGFWALHDLLVDRAQRRTSESERDDEGDDEAAARDADEDVQALAALAEQAGLDATRMRAALAAGTHSDAVREDVALAARLGAGSGPTFFVNGARLPGEAPLPRVREVIERVRTHAAALSPRERVYALMVDAPVRTTPEAPVTPRGAFGCANATQATTSDAERIPVGRSPVQGCSDALVTVVVFSDFQCPFCSRAESTIQSLRERYGADLRVVWKNNPLPFHDHAMLAAEAAMEAYAQRGAEGFWRFHDVLFEEQQSLSREDLERYAERFELDMDRFRDALDEHTHHDEIERDMQLAQEINAQGTPNFFINGSQLVGAQPLERFTALIDEVLVRARTAPRGEVYAQMVADPVAAPDPPAPRPTPPQRTEDPTAVYAVPVDHAPTLGPANALVTLVVFSDFQCPFCSRVEPTIQALRRRYGNDLRVVWRNEPLPFHNHAQLAAEAAMEAYAQRGHDGFWHFHDALFADQQHLEREDLERTANRLELDMTRFRAALDQHTHAAEIDADLALSRRLDANGTPHFFVNGHRLVGAQPQEVFERAIDEARTRAQATLRTTRGLTRDGLYARIVAGGATGTVYLPGSAPAADGGADDENRVYTVRANPRAPSFGAPRARVVIEHFSDLQCPFCARVQPVIEQIRARYGTRVRFAWRDYPLPFHDHAMLAAEAAREALAQQGNAGFWRFERTLFEHQSHLERADLERYAQTQGLNLTRFRAALDAHSHQAGIRDDMAAADATGAQIGTPAFFINGRFVAGALPFEEFQRRIDAALQSPAAR